MNAFTAVTRFGLGPSAADLERVAADPKGAVLAELDGPPPVAPALRKLPDLETLAATYLGARARHLEAVRAARRDGRRDGADPDSPVAQARQEFVVYRRDVFRAEVAGRVRTGLQTDRPLVERLVLFFTNHFTVARNAPHALVLLGHRERAIRPLVLGRFRDLLEAAVLHPMMLTYLDNAASVGPQSRAGRRSGRSYNENLARELLELHTVGVHAGYTQDDVIALALVLTGWTGGFEIDRRRAPDEQGLGPAFDPSRHEPGSKTILGRTYAEAGAEEIRQVFDDLAAHPGTARHIARKLAVHFVGEGVSDATVAALEETFLATDGDIAAVMTTLLATDEAWTAPPRKVIPPYDFVVSAYRAFDARFRLGPVNRAFDALGYRIWNPPSPAGWPDGDKSWVSGDTLLERIDWASEFASDVAPRDENIEDEARAILGAAFDGELATAIRRAEDRTQAVTLLLMSPKWQVR
jgi:uncharacterized protein (DUF1800 family)